MRILSLKAVLTHHNQKAREIQLQDTQVPVKLDIEAPSQTQENTRLREVTQKEKEEFILTQRNSNTLKKEKHTTQKKLAHEVV